MIKTATERQIKMAASLKRKKGRDEHSSFQIEGVRLLESALQAGVQTEYVFVTESARSDSRLKRLLDQVTDKVRLVSEREMGKIADTTSPSGVVAVANMPTPTTECITCMQKVLVLDGVSDPGNVGTLIRTAAWFGVNAVVSGPGTADYYAPKTVRSSMGGLFSMIFEKVDNLPGFIATNMRAGVDVRIADMDGTPAGEWKPGEHSMVVIGSEAHGVSQEVRLASNGSICIPSGVKGSPVESLNAAVAGAILISHW